MTGSVRSLPDCLPRWQTPRNPDRETLGPRVAQASALLGKPFMPWQSLVSDVSHELDPATGQLWYREIVITVPRQSGKTTLVLAAAVRRALGHPIPQVITYTAQSRIKAREKWEDEHLPILERSPLAPFFRVRKTTGNEAILWRNGSRHGIDASTDKAGHGPTVDLGILDEAFAHADSRVEQGLKPSMVTRPGAQLLILSTAGTAASVYLRGKVNAGRVRCEMGMPSRVAYFEYSAADEADPADPATWYGCMPALGHVRADGTGVTEETVQAEFDSMELADFRRAYLNQWLDAFPEEWLVITAGDWAAGRDPSSAAVDPVAFAVDMTPNRAHTSIGTAARRPDGLLHCEVVEHRPDSDWVVARAVELDRRHSPCAWVVDPGAAAGSLITELELAGLNVLKPSVREVAQACGQFFDAVSAGVVRHLGQPGLSAAVAGAVSRPLADAWAWDRKNTSVDICPLVAVTLAAWGHALRAPAADVGVWVI
jgi:Terminase large subunit, T4likevirus-type, N-terminal